MPTAPTPTPEQRQAALERATEARLERADMLNRVSAGTLTLGDVLRRDDDMARKTHVAKLLRALPGYGPTKAARLLESCGIDAGKKVGGLGGKQEGKLLTAVHG